VDGLPIKFYIWDTAGQEKYRSLVSAYFKGYLIVKLLGCQAVIIVFDLTDYVSFDQAIDVWLKLSREKT
jgi:GTPase SAR1 family protein